MNTQFNNKITIKPARVLGMLVTMAVILTACAPAATPATTPSVTQPATTPSVSSAPTTVTIDVATDPTLGKILVDSKGITLYVFTKDAADASACDASCQANWPPLVTSGTPKAGPGVDAALIGETNLGNGEKVVTYDHRPLYYKATDKKVGDKTGEGINNVWFMVSPAGQPVTGTSSASPTPTPGASAPTPTPAPSIGAATPAPTAMMITEPMIDVANSSTLGKILVGDNGMTLYAYSADAADTSNCGAACQAVWMPVLTLGHPALGTGVTASMIGTAKLANGNMIVTYNHMPLYYFVNDTASGQTTGQGFDNVWFAVSPDGKKVGKVTEVTINIGTNPLLGSYLVDGKGEALYVFSKDTANTSNCNAACMAFWPPVLTLGKPNLAGLDQSMAGTIKLPDGSMMLTYNHMPLYYFSGDGNRNQQNGQGFKSLWYLLGSDGNKVTSLLPTPITAEPTINVEKNATYGQILADGNGMTLYVNINDKIGESSCLASCMHDWTPLFTLGHPNIGTGVNSSLIGTITTSYGFKIVTYNNKPLYLAKSDTKPGDVTGEDANVSWYVISVDGQPVVKR